MVTFCPVLLHVTLVLMKATVVFKRPLPSAHLYVMMHSCWLRKDGQLRIPVVCCSHLLLGWTRVDANHTFLAWLRLSHTALLAIWPCKVFQAISEDLFQVSMHLKLTYLAFFYMFLVLLCMMFQLNMSLKHISFSGDIIKPFLLSPSPSNHLSPLWLITPFSKIQLIHDVSDMLIHIFLFHSEIHQLCK